jgi:hypothetical protein
MSGRVAVMLKGPLRALSQKYDFSQSAQNSEVVTAMEQLNTPIKHLRKPLQIGDTTLRNRFGMSSISRNR